MLKIRQEQWDRLSEVARERFIRDVVAGIRQYWPGDFDARGESAVRASVATGIDQARALGLEREYDVHRYINLLYALGSDFQTDARYPWVAEILDDPHLDPGERIDAICARAEEELASGAG